MNRRDFLRSAGVAAAALALPKMGRAGQAATTGAGGWRTFEVTTHVEVLKPSGMTRIWLPEALIVETPFQKTLANTFSASGRASKVAENQPEALGIVAAEFLAGVAPVLTLTSRVALRNIAVDLSASGKAQKTDRADLAYFLQPTKLLPTDGIVKATAMEITKGANTDVEKARAMSQVSVTIDGRKYRLACNEGEEARLESLAIVADAWRGRFVRATGVLVKTPDMKRLTQNEAGYEYRWQGFLLDDDANAFVFFRRRAQDSMFS